MALLEHTSGSAAAPPSPTAQRRNLRDFGRFGPSIALVILVVVFTAINPGAFLSPENIGTMLDQAAVPLIIVTGLTFVILMGSIDLSIEGVMAAAGLTFVLLSANSSNGNDFGILALVVALAVGTALGVLHGLLVVRVRIPSIIATLGTWYIGLGIAAVLYGGAATTLRPSPLVAWISGTTFGISTSFWIAALMCLAGLAISRWTTMGRAAYAIGDNEAVARVAGIRVDRQKIAIFAFGSFAAALAGIVGTVRLGAGLAEVGQGQLFFSLTAVVVGGTFLSGGQGGVARSIIGVLLLTVLNNGLVLSGVDPVIQQAIFGCVIVIAVIALGLRQRRVVRIVK